MTAAEIRQAIDAVSVRCEDPSADRAEADRLVALARQLTRDELFGVLHVAGVEVIRAHDSKAYLLARLYARLTARVRAHERSEV
jgi:hypothetical protein